MVHEVVDAVGGEVCQKGHGYGLIGIDTKEGDRPFGGVAGAKGHLVASYDACGFEEDMDFFDIDSDIFIRVFLAAEIAERLVFPVRLDDFFEFGEIMRIGFLAGNRFKIGMFHFF